MEAEKRTSKQNLQTPFHMIVSNFELLSRLLNLGSRIDTRRRIAQGYFLAISNLENRVIHLRLRLVIPDSIFSDREIETDAVPFFGANTKAIFDNANKDDLLIELTSVTPASPNTRLHTREFITGSFSIFPNQTVSVAILPIPLLSSNFEVRGFIVLEQVPVRVSETLTGVPAAVVLTTPDQRNTTIELDDNNPGRILRVADFDQTVNTLPTASGKAQNTVEAIRGLIRPPVLDPNDSTVVLPDESEIIGLEKAFVEALQNSKSVAVE